MPDCLPNLPSPSASGDNGRQSGVCVYVEGEMTCAIFGFTKTDNHNLIRRSRWGEHTFTIDLCPNCHRMYHIIESDSSERISTLVDSLGTDSTLIARALAIGELVRTAQNFDLCYGEMTALERILEHAHILQALVKGQKHDNLA